MHYIPIVTQLVYNRVSSIDVYCIVWDEARVISAREHTH